MTKQKRTPKEILNAAKTPDQARVRASFYLLEDNYLKFKKKCDDNGALVSKVVDELIKEFLTNN